jgi:hypothetical protein
MSSASANRFLPYRFVDEASQYIQYNNTDKLDARRGTLVNPWKIDRISAGQVLLEVVTDQAVRAR